MAYRIRPATVLDLLSMGRSPRTDLRLDLVEQLLSPRQGGQGLLSWLHPNGPDLTLLCWDPGGLQARVEARSGTGARPWEIVGLTAWTGDPAAAAAPWSELLVALGVAASQQGAARLLARLADEPWVDLFRQVGFTPFAEELLLAWDGATAAAGRQLTDLRPVQAADQEAIQRLYTALTPPIVLQAEGGWSESVEGPAGEESWVWLEPTGARAYLRRHRGRHGTRLSLLLDPAWRQEAAAVLAHGLRGAALPVYLVLRSYQGELLDVAHRLGFRSYAEQVLLVKHLAAAQKVHYPAPGRQVERPLGAAPSTPAVAGVSGPRCKRANVRTY